MARFFCNTRFFFFFFFVAPGQKYLTESTYREKPEFWLMVSVTSVCVASSAASGYAEEGSRGGEYEAEAVTPIKATRKRGERKGPWTKHSP